MKKCPICDSRKTKKKGLSRGVQRYICNDCKRTFGSIRKPSRLRFSLWQDFVFNRHTIKQLAVKHKRSFNWVRKQLRDYKSPPPASIPREMVAVMDCTFFGRTRGWLVVRDPHQKENFYWSEIERENLDEYRFARDTLESLGFVILAVVADGKPGLKPLYKDIPVQMCHYHMKAIITRKLTRRPKLEAGIELRELTFKLDVYCEKCFTSELKKWHEKWREFLAEKSLNKETGKLRFKHRSLRSAHRSLKKHLPYLFTYKRYPELNIPNTSNSLEGFFKHLKNLVRVHQGIKADLKRKIINSILQNRPTKK